MIVHSIAICDFAHTPKARKNLIHVPFIKRLRKPYSRVPSRTESTEVGSMEAMNMLSNERACSLLLPTTSVPLRFSNKSSLSLKMKKRALSSQLTCSATLVVRDMKHHITVCQAAVASTTTSAQGQEDEVQITQYTQPNCRVRLNVRVPLKLNKQCFQVALAELRKKVEVPGFRRGEKVPDQVLANYIGMEKVKTAAIELVLNKTLPEAMYLVKDKALRDSEHISTGFNEMLESFSPSSVFSYDVVVDLAPEVKWASPEAYKNLKIVVEVESDSLIEKSAEAEFKMCHKDLGSLKVVQGRGLQIGDIAVLDVSAVKVMDDGTDGDKLPFTEQKGFHLDTEETGNLVPGFLDAILGIERGQRWSFTVTFPDSWQQKELQGVHARFYVECEELFYRVLPTLDDTLADKFISGCESISQVREMLLKKHREMAESRKKQIIHTAILQELMKVVDVDIPHSLLEDHGRNLYGAKLLQLQTSMKLTEDDIFNLSSSKMVNEYLISQKEMIKESVIQSLAVEDISKIENLKCSEEEVEEEVEKTAEEFKRYKYEFDREKLIEQAQELLQGEKVMQWLTEVSDIQYVTKDE